MNNISVYGPSYANQLLRGKDLTSRGWDIVSFVTEYCQHDDVFLDIGCGTAYKTIPLHHQFNRLLGLDLSDTLLRKAWKNIGSIRISV